MLELRRRMKRVVPIIRARKALVEQETYRLALLVREREELKTLMRKRQTEYVRGVGELNELRCNPDRKALAVFEQALDGVRESWVDYYKKVQAAERKITIQIENVNRAQRKLKAIENLKKTYEERFRAFIAKKDQEVLDEFAIRQFVGRKSDE